MEGWREGERERGRGGDRGIGGISANLRIWKYVLNIIYLGHENKHKIF